MSLVLVSRLSHGQGHCEGKFRHTEITNNQVENCKLQKQACLTPGMSDTRHCLRKYQT